MTRRLLLQAFIGAGALVDAAPPPQVPAQCEQGWALRDKDGTFRTHSCVGQTAADATMFNDYEVDGYAKAWGAQKVWLRRTVTTTCEVRS